jgi:hypothetical protein
MSYVLVGFTLALTVAVVGCMAVAMSAVLFI